MKQFLPLKTNRMVLILLQSFHRIVALLVMLCRVQLGFEYFRALGAFEYFPTMKSGVMRFKRSISIHILSALRFSTITRS